MKPFLTGKKKTTWILCAAMAFPALGAFGEDIYGPSLALKDFQQGRYLEIDKNFDTVMAQADPNPKELLALDEKALGRPENLNLLRAWLAQNPRSAAGWASMGFLYKTYADSLRAKGAAPSSSDYSTMLTSYKTCLDRACLVAPQAAYLWGLEIQSLQWFSPNDSMMENYFQNGLRLDRNCFSIFAAKAQYLAHQNKPDWPKIKDFLTGAAQRSSPNSYARLLVVYYHQLYAESNPDVLSDYLQQPDNWNDIVSGLGDYLWNHPDDVQIRSWYARLSMEAQKYTEAAKQFKPLGEDAYLYGGWGSKEEFLEKKKYAEEHK